MRPFYGMRPLLSSLKFVNLYRKYIFFYRIWKHCERLPFHRDPLGTHTNFKLWLQLFSDELAEQTETKTNKHMPSSSKDVYLKYLDTLINHNYHLCLINWDLLYHVMKFIYSTFFIILVHLRFLLFLISVLTMPQ